MLGEKQNRWVTQSGWIKSLIATFVRSWDRKRGISGGLFGGRSKNEGEVLGWSRGQQAAFLIYSWRALRDAIAKSNEEWAQSLRHPPMINEKPALRPEDIEQDDDLAFYSPNSLLATDQGVRGFLHVLNDLFYQRAAAMKLNDWRPDDRSSADPLTSVERELEALENQEFTGFVSEIVTRLASFDWRTSSAPELSNELRRAKLVFRGSSGYKELRAQLLEHLECGTGDVQATAKTLLGRA